MDSLKTGIVLCALLSAAVVLPYEFERVEVDGLSHNSVYSILQDREGFLWLGTADGLNRYDGREVVVYRNDPDDASSLAGNVVYVLAEDRSGALWIGTDGGVSRLEAERTEFFQAATCDGAAVEQVITLVEDEGGTIWAGSPAGLSRFETETGCWNEVAAFRGLGVGLIRRGVGSQLLVKSMRQGFESLHLLDPVSLEVEEIPMPDDLESFFSFHLAASRELWLDASGPAMIAKGARWVELETRAPSGSQAWAFAEQEDGIVWIGTNLGLLRWQPDEKHLEPVTIEPSRGAWLANHVRALYLDRDGALWVGTHGGLYRHDPFRKRFVTLTSDSTNPNSLSGRAISALCEDVQGFIWVGTFGAGVNRIDPEAGSIRHYHHPDRAAEPLREVVWSLVCGERGRIWVADSVGLASLDPVTGTYTEHPEAYPFEEPLRTLRRGRAGDLWVGGLSGLCRYEPDPSEARCYQADTKVDGLDIGGVESLLLDGVGGLWIGGNGLTRLELETGELSRYRLAKEEGRFVGGEGLWVLHRSASGILWLGSGSGLTSLDPGSGALRHMSTRDGLPGSMVYGILEDDRGRLWLGTNNGLAVFDPEAPDGLGFRAFDSSDGVMNSEFNRRAALETSAGEFYFGGLDGLTVFNPEQLRTNPRPPQVAISGITVWNREGATERNPWAIDRLPLSHRDTIVAFDFVALSYTNPEKNLYAYRLEGFDEHWADAGSLGSARYTTLAPGQYVFRVMASNSDGVWNEVGASLPVIVTPPFWQTWWFRTSVALLIIAAAFALHRVRINRLLELEKVRLQIASDLHDDLSSNLAGVALETDMLRQSPGLAQEYQDRLGELRDTTLDMVASLRDIVWIINPEHDTLESLEARMQRTAKSLATGKELSFSSNLSDSLNLGMALRRNLFLIFKEAVHNAIRHADAGRLDIELGEVDSNLRLLVRDDGRGFSEEKIVAGHGLRSMRWRAQQMGAMLAITSNPGSGTEVVLELKIT